MGDTTTKRCAGCDKILLKSRFARNKIGRLDSYCVDCRVRIESSCKERLSQYRTCSRCKTLKPKEDFGVDTRNSGGRKARCKKCHTEIMREYRKHNPEITRETNKKAKSKRRDYYSSYNKTYYQENKEYLRAMNKRWRNENGDRIKNNNATRRAREHGAVGNGITSDQWRQIVALFGGKCLFPGCGRNDITMDHIVPLVLGGAHDTYNVQPLCRSHNSSKRIRIIDYRGLSEWT